MMRLWGSAIGCGSAGADLGKNITLFAMTGDCTSQPPSEVPSLAAFDVAYCVARPVAPSLQAPFSCSSRPSATGVPQVVTGDTVSQVFETRLKFLPVGPFIQFAGAGGRLDFFRRQSAIRSALPFGLGTGIRLLHLLLPYLYSGL
jgi:hypothetical protein